MNVFKNLKNLLESKNSHIEHTALNHWKTEAEETLAYLKSNAPSVEEAVDDMKDYKQYDHKTAFQTITGLKHSEDNSVRRLWINAASVAAASIVVLAAYFLMRPQVNIPSETIVANTIKEVILEDKSEVTLDQSTSLTKLSSRKVKLEGRGFFKVKSTPDKDKFVVELNKGTVTVLGTRFSINTNSIENEVDVEEGKVQYEYNGQKVMLTAGQSVSLINGQLVMKSVKNNTFSWKNQILEFVDIPVEQAIEDISKHYKIKIAFDRNLTMKSSCLITTKFKNESADEMMKELKTLLGITYLKSGNGYLITSIKC